MKNFLYISDIHIPFADFNAMNKCIDFIKKKKPENIILGGDIIDFYTLSKFDKDPLINIRFNNEVDEIKKFFGVLRKASKKSKIYYLSGNHELRLIKFLRTKAPELLGLVNLEFENLFELEKFNIEWIDENQVLQLDDWIIRHGHENPGVSSVPGGNARKRATMYGGNFIQGHCHRGNVLTIPNYRNIYFYAIENPCLCIRDAEYMRGFAQWQQGWTFVVFDTTKNNWRIEQTIL